MRKPYVKKKKPCLWMIVTLDELELPIAVFDSAKEMAEFSGITVDSIYSEISHEKYGLQKRTKYKKVILDEVV